MLFVSEEATVVEHDNTGVKLAGPGELQEIADIRCDEDPILVERLVEDLAVGRFEQPAIAQMNCVNP